MHQDAMRDLVAARDQRTVNSSARALGEQLDHRKTVIQSIGNQIPENLSQDEFLSSVAFLLDDFDGGLAVLTPEGKLISYSGPSSDWLDLSQEVADHLAQTRLEFISRSQISDPFYIKSRDDIYSVITYQSHSKSAIIVGVFSVTNLARENLAGILSYDNVGSVILVDQNKNLLYQAGFLNISGDLENFPGITEALLGESGTAFLDADDG